MRKLVTPLSAATPITIQNLQNPAILEEEFEVKVIIGVHQESVLSPLVFAIVVDVVTESVRNGLMSKMLVLTSETMEGLRGKFWKWK